MMTVREGVPHVTETGTGLRTIMAMVKRTGETAELLPMVTMAIMKDNIDHEEAEEGFQASQDRANLEDREATATTTKGTIDQEEEEGRQVSRGRTSR